MRKEWIAYIAAGVVLLVVIFGFSFFSGSVRPASNDLDGEANAKAKEYFDRTVARCGSAHYVKAERIDVRQGQLVQTESLFQLDNPTAAVEKRKEPLSRADELNHTQWEGSIRVNAVAHREHSQVSGWSSWSDGPPYNYSENPLLAGGVLNSNLTKQNGRWQFGSLDIGKPRVSKPDCSEIPPG